MESKTPFERIAEGFIRWFLVSLACLVGGGGVALWWFNDDLSNFDREWHNRFAGITEEMLRQEVIVVLGAQRHESDKFFLGQRDGYEEHYERAASSKSQYYLMWHNGIDVTYAVGFDKDDRVTMTAWGGT